MADNSGDSIYKVCLPAGKLPNWLVCIYHAHDPHPIGIFELHSFMDAPQWYRGDELMKCDDLAYDKWLETIAAQCGYSDTDRILCTVPYDGKDTEIEIKCRAQWITALRLMASVGYMKFRIESAVEASDTEDSSSSVLAKDE